MSKIELSQALGRIHSELMMMDWNNPHVKRAKLLLYKLAVALT